MHREKLLGGLNERREKLLTEAKESVAPGGKHAAKLEAAAVKIEGLKEGFGSVVRAT